jgi:hypothetical protein
VSTTPNPRIVCGAVISYFRSEFSVVPVDRDIIWNMNLHTNVTASVRVPSGRRFFEILLVILFVFFGAGVSCSAEEVPEQTAMDTTDSAAEDVSDDAKDSVAENGSEEDWVRIAVTGRAYSPAEWAASSVLEAEHFWEISRYDPGKALDKDPGTAWAEGAPGPGTGESIVLAFTGYPEALGFINGFAQTQDLFIRNHRVKALNVELYTAVNIDGFFSEVETLYDALLVSPSRTVSLADTREPQRVSLPVDRSAAQRAMEKFRTSDTVTNRRFPQAVTMGVEGDTGMGLSFRYILRLEIAEVYRGTSWEDTCIAEIWPDYGKIADVAVDDSMRQLVLTTPEGQRVPGYADFEYVLTMVEKSENAEWVIVIKEPAYADSGRVTSEYAVIHAPTGWDMTTTMLPVSDSGVVQGIPYGFAEEEGDTFVLYEDPVEDTKGQALCVPVYDSSMIQGN